jgi:UDPglucose 6-dehydrogenase
MRVAMIGAGYVGLVSGACFADFGHHVSCADKNAERIAALKRGVMPIYEPRLAELWPAICATAGSPSRLSWPRRSALPTPCSSPSARRRGDGHADLSYVYAAARESAGALNGFYVLGRSSISNFAWM